MPQFKSEKAAEKKINPHVYWSLIFEALKGKKKQADIHVHSSKVYNSEQPSQENNHRVSDMRFTLFWNHTEEQVVTN